MDPLVTLIVFLSFWCLSHQQEQDLTLCRGNRSLLAHCGAGRTPFPGELPPGWGRTCEAGTTPCLLTSQNIVESTQYYTAYRCDSENLNYLCLPANQTVDICQEGRQTREGNTSLVHGQLMASRGDNVTCTCVVTRSPDQAHSGVLILLYTRHLAQPPVAEAAPCQRKLTLRDSVKQGPTLCLLTTRPTGQDSNEASLDPEYAPYLNETKALTITYELDGGDTWGQDQLLPFALRISGTGSYDIECGRLDHNGTESTGSAVSTTTTAVLTNKKFEATSIDNPSSTSSTAGSGDDGEGPQINVTGLTIGLTVALAVVVLVVLVIVVCCLLRKRRMTRDKPDNDVDPYSVTLRRNRKDKPPPDPDHESGRRREAEGRPHGDEGRDGSDTEAGSGGGEATGGDGVAVDPSDTCATVDRSRKDRDSADLTMQENNVYSSHSQPIENS